MRAFVLPTRLVDVGRTAGRSSGRLSGRTALPVALGLLLHGFQPVVVVGELPEVRQRDLSREQGVVVSHVSPGVAGSVLEFDV